MIKVKITNEMFCDLFTPSISRKCVEGLPGGAFLLSVEIPPLESMVYLTFHDGKDEVTHTKLKFQ